jgi:hypothetical protein
MAIEAPAAKYKKNNLKLYIAACIVFAAIFAYDGYLSQYPWAHRQKFYEKHVKDGKPDSTMVFNRISPVFILGLAAFLGWRLMKVSGQKVTADDEKLVIDNTLNILYSSIEKIDKTHFSSKGYFVLTYKDSSNNTQELELSNKKYDKLSDILQVLVEKIS